MAVRFSSENIFGAWAWVVRGVDTGAVLAYRRDLNQAFALLEAQGWELVLC